MLSLLIHIPPPVQKQDSLIAYSVNMGGEDCKFMNQECTSRTTKKDGAYTMPLVIISTTAQQDITFIRHYHRHPSARPLTKILWVGASY